MERGSSKHGPRLDEEMEGEDHRAVGIPYEEDQ